MKQSILDFFKCYHGKAIKNEMNNGKRFWFTSELSYLQYGEDTQKLYCE